MRHMTKEWYDTMQKTDFHLLLKVSKKAETFSEEYFKKLYQKEEAERLQSREEAANVKIEDIYPEEFYMENVDGTPVDPEEFEEVKKRILRCGNKYYRNAKKIPSSLIPNRRRGISNGRFDIM